MRLTLKHQILLAPAAILLMLTLLLGFMQYAYWDLSVKRREASELRNTIIAIVEADMAAQRMHHLADVLEGHRVLAVERLEEAVELYAHLKMALQQILVRMELSESTR